MRLLKKYILLLVVFTAGISTLQAQNEVKKVEEINKGYVDMKEFEDNSFEDAMPTTIKDSSILFQHLIGIKYGCSMNSVNFNQDIRTKPVYSPINVGVYYTYLHALWDSMPYFGLQVGLEYTGIGTNVFFGEEDSENETHINYSYNALMFPLTTQFRADFSIIRLMANAGAYGYYILNEANGAEIPSTTNLYGCGLTAGGGVAIKLHPIELHLECNYKYSLSNFFIPQIYSDTYWTYTHSTQLQISVGLIYNFSKKKK